ncbi:hypothetical protein KSP40_PGU015944 [Platanthera guangdongensis]|uniref:Uncharacterized protein n=1 Tax=Platanthera guangdongensis TaxID=2320717 RepID=A0ABR2LM31_9ASPA
MWEEIAVPSLRKSLKDVSIEKDAAIVWKEDALSQLRTTKKRLKEAEEEQYKAEEDAAALRSELNSLQRQVLENPYVSVDKAVDDVLLMQKEIAELKSLLQQESLLRKQEQGKLAEQQHHASSLMSEKLDLEDRMAALSKKISVTSPSSPFLHFNNRPAPKILPFFPYSQSLSNTHSEFPTLQEASFNSPPPPANFWPPQTTPSKLMFLSSSLAVAQLSNMSVLRRL